ncbi:MAG: urease accessory protein UreE [Rubrivivax sp.]|nr:urease accessory protein UreE [Rubrivivax sp.]
MLTVSKLIPGARGLAGVLLKRAATVELDWDLRQKSRFDTADSSGRALGVFLPRGSVVRGGDALVAEDGSLIVVTAAAQPVLVVRHCSAHGSPFDLLRAAYHLGNRHVPLELQPDHLKLEPDHVLADMLRGMHLIVSEQQAAFEPESGAYGTSGHVDAHAHAHVPVRAHPPADAEAEAHALPHGDAHAHAHAHAVVKTDDHGPVTPRRTAVSRPAIPIAAAAPHVHGPGCNHDHGHEHTPGKHDH